MTELERRLTQLGHELDWPAAPDLAANLRERLAAPVPGRRRPVVVPAGRSRSRSPPSSCSPAPWSPPFRQRRDAVLEFFGLQGATVERREQLPRTPPPRAAQPGRAAPRSRPRATPSASSRCCRRPPGSPTECSSTRACREGGSRSPTGHGPGYQRRAAPGSGCSWTSSAATSRPSTWARSAGQATRIRHSADRRRPRHLAGGRAALLLLPLARRSDHGGPATDRAERAPHRARPSARAAGGSVQPRARAGAGPVTPLVVVEQALHRPGEPQRGEQQGHQPGDDHDGRGPVEEVGHERDRASHGERK